MIAAGFDIGARYIKLALVKENRTILGLKKSPTSYDTNEKVFAILTELCSEKGISEDEEKRIGIINGNWAFENGVLKVSELKAIAKAVAYLYPEARTIVDVGAEDSKVIRINGSGAVVDMAVNEKCAAGAGSFVEVMAKALDMSLEEFGQRALESEERIAMNAQCTVFAESEVVSLIHSGVNKKDIARAVIEAIATRVSSLIRKVRMEPEVLLVGGMARNSCFVLALKNILEIDNLIVPQNPEFISAIGAALTVLEENR